jgi:hypothetical protein
MPPALALAVGRCLVPMWAQAASAPVPIELYVRPDDLLIDAAEAYAQRAGKRLPTEAEWPETLARLSPEHRSFALGPAVDVGFRCVASAEAPARCRLDGD